MEENFTLQSKIVKDEKKKYFTLGTYAFSHSDTV
jgi:hypothetical protein